MKRQQIALIGGAALVLIFVVAGLAYKNQQSREIEAIAQSASSPLERPYSQGTGPADAKVVLVEFFDPACETCRVFHQHVKNVLASHPGKIRLVLRYAPFHHGSDVMVKILEATRLQDKYWEALQVMYDTQPQWASHHHPQPEKIWQFLPSAGVDVDRVRRDMNSPEILDILDQDVQDGRTLGVRKTPQFFVNDKPLMNFGVRQLQALVDSEIAANYP